MWLYVLLYLFVSMVMARLLFVAYRRMQWLGRQNFSKRDEYAWGKICIPLGLYWPIIWPAVMIMFLFGSPLMRNLAPASE